MYEFFFIEVGAQRSHGTDWAALVSFGLFCDAVLEAFLRSFAAFCQRTHTQPRYTPEQVETGDKFVDRVSK